MVSYDTRTTVFSPEGNIFQVEYALKAVESAGLCLALKGTDSIVLITENKIQSKLLEKAPTSSLNESVPSIATISGKVHKIDDNFFCASAGLAPDTNTLIERLREISSENYSTYGTPIPISKAVRQMADIKQYLTQHGGSRPYGTSLIYFGVENDKLVLFSSNPTGNFEKYHAVAIGNQSAPSMSEVDAQLSRSDSSDNYSSQNISELGTTDLLKLSVRVVMSTVGAGSRSINDGKLEIFVIKLKSSDSAFVNNEFYFDSRSGPNALQIITLSQQEISKLVEDHAERSTNDDQIDMEETE